MKSNQKEIIENFCKILVKEMDSPIKIDYSVDMVQFSYKEIVISIEILDNLNNKDSFDYCETDLVDSLCRMRLLVVERFNRLLPNDKRHYAYQDLGFGLEFEIPSIFLTDKKKEILVCYNR